MQRNLKKWRSKTPASHRSYSEKRNRKERYDFLCSDEESQNKSSDYSHGRRGQ